MKASPLHVSYQQLYGDSPMEVTLEQQKTFDGMTITERGTFTIKPKDALILVAMLAPLARNVLPKPKLEGDKPANCDYCGLAKSGHTSGTLVDHQRTAKAKAARR